MHQAPLHEKIFALTSLIIKISLLYYRFSSASFRSIPPSPSPQSPCSLHHCSQFPYLVRIYTIKTQLTLNPKSNQGQKQLLNKPYCFACLCLSSFPPLSSLRKMKYHKIITVFKYRINREKKTKSTKKQKKERKKEREILAA